MKRLALILLVLLGSCTSSTSLVSSVSVRNGWDVQIINSIPLK